MTKTASPLSGNGEELPLSTAQLSIWHDIQINPKDTSYCVWDYIEIALPIDIERLRNSIQQVIKESRPLHANFYETENEPVQVIPYECEAEIPIIDLSDRALDAAHSWMKADHLRPFDLQNDRLARNALILTATGKVIWYRNYHHLIVDGYGRTLLGLRVTNFYNKIASKTPSDDYSTHLTENQRYLASERFETDKAYWKSLYRILPQRVSLSRRTPRQRAPRSFAMLNRVLPKEIANTYAKVANELGISSSDIFIALAILYIHRTTGETDIPFCLPTHGRERGKTDNLVGMCASVIAPRVSLDSHKSIRETIVEISRQVRDAVDHRRFPQEAFRRELGLFPMQTPPFGIHVNVLRSDGPMTFEGRFVEQESQTIGPTDDMSIMLVDNRRIVRLSIFFNSNLYEECEIQSHAQNFEYLLQNACSMLDEKVIFLPIAER